MAKKRPVLSTSKPTGKPKPSKAPEQPKPKAKTKPADTSHHEPEPPPARTASRQVDAWAAGPAPSVNRGGRPRKPGTEELVQTTVRLPPHIHAASVMVCKTRRLSLGELVAELIEQAHPEAVRAVLSVGLSTPKTP